MSPIYTPDQLAQYFTHISLPQKYQPSFSSSPPLDLAYLTALHVHQISTIPYENLSLHYSTNRTISLDPQVLFDKFITKGCNRGGYCMEDTLFFLFVLQSLGFDVYPTGVRIRLREDGVPKGDFIGLVHIVLICTLPTGQKYILDTAFGGDGPTTPQPLLENNITFNLGTQENRFILAPIAQNPARSLTKPHKFWIWQYRNSPAKEWNAFYCFTETEFLLGDFGVMNFFTSEGKTFQRVTILCVKFLRGEGEEGESKVTGKLMLINGTLKRNLGGRTEVVKECRTEAERIEVLEQYFGITLTEEEQASIKGLVTELKGGVEVIAA